ncbi:MAG: FAD-binding oxidoreductase, partial [Acidobacteriota bacterium]|nr:FAD-binding oxidoreductase [Acidobacteriota bacterium]
MKRRLSGWGRYPTVEAEERFAPRLTDITDGAVLTRAYGRSYGDASLPAAGDGPVANARSSHRVLGFDAATGLLHAEAGFGLEELNRRFWDEGWAAPVTPGTAQVSVGGMIASDVHGKNHHVAGTLGHFVESIEIQTADGQIHTVGQGDAEGLFAATVGGMGLTGHILSARLRLESIASPWIHQHIRVCRDLDGLLEGLAQESRRSPMTVAWADALAGGGSMGRGIVIGGRWAERGEAPERAQPRATGFRLPFDL